jgi:hypothetical protein
VGIGEKVLVSCFNIATTKRTSHLAPNMIDAVGTHPTPWSHDGTLVVNDIYYNKYDC